MFIIFGPSVHEFDPPASKSAQRPFFIPAPVCCAMDEEKKKTTSYCVLITWDIRVPDL